MLRSLLEDRFRLSAHRETRDLPIYALVRRARLTAGLALDSDGRRPTSAPGGSKPLPRRTDYPCTGGHPVCGIRGRQY